MPYIKPEHRDAAFMNPMNAGELNYAITMRLIEYLNSHQYNYQTMNDIMGALEGAKLEFYRRIASPYENQKIDENGDVYDE